MPAGWVAAGAAVIGGIESIQANNKAGEANAINRQNAEQLNSAEQDAFTSAENISNTPFTPYTEPFAAPLTPNEITAGEQAYKAAGPNGPAAQDYAKADTQIDQVAGNDFSGANVNKYMDPYVRDVVNNEIERANQTYGESRAQNATETAASGAFGTDRSALQEATLEGQHELDVGNLAATGYSNAYQNAISAWQADNQRRLSAAGAYQTNGGDITKMDATQIADLMQTGGAQRAVEQTNLNGQYQEFLRGQNWSATELQPLISSIGAARGVNVQPATQSNAANSILGMASVIAGLAGGGGSSAGVTAEAAPNYGVTGADSTGLGYFSPGAG